MPEMDGVDVTKSVKHLRPDIDVIIITGYATVETAVEVYEIWCNGLCSKTIY